MAYLDIIKKNRTRAAIEIIDRVEEMQPDGQLLTVDRGNPTVSATINGNTRTTAMKIADSRSRRRYGKSSAEVDAAIAVRYALEGATKLAAELGVTSSTVTRRANRMGIYLR